MSILYIPEKLQATVVNTYTARPVCWSWWISDSYCSLKPLCSGMGEIVPARTSLTLLTPSPRTVLSLSCFKVSQCINCCDWHCKSLCHMDEAYIHTFCVPLHPFLFPSFLFHSFFSFFPVCLYPFFFFIYFLMYLFAIF